MGDAVDLIPFVQGLGEGVRIFRKTKRVVENVDNVVDAAKATYKAADAASSIKQATGTYEIIFKNGKNYVGKGGFQRAIHSATKHADNLSDIDAIRWKPSKDTIHAFMEEYALQTIRKLDPIKTYNKIWSPGKKFYNTLVQMK